MPKLNRAFWSQLATDTFILLLLGAYWLAVTEQKVQHYITGRR